MEKSHHERWSPEEAFADRLKRRMAWEGKKAEKLLIALNGALRAELEQTTRQVRADLHRIEGTLEIIAREFARRADEQ